MNNNRKPMLNVEQLNKNLRSAIIEVNLEKLKEFIKLGADVNLLDENGERPLHLAVELGHLEVMKELIQAKANVNLRDICGKRPIHYAAESKKINILQELLIIDECYRDAIDNIGKTALHYAAQTNNRPAVELLIKKEASSSIFDNEDMSPLHCAAKNGHDDIVELLYPHGDHKNKIGKTALHYAAEEVHYTTVNKLLELGADVNAKTNVTRNGVIYSKSPLHYILNISNHRFIIKLLDNKSEVDFSKDLETIKSLLKYGVRVNDNIVEDTNKTVQDNATLLHDIIKSTNLSLSIIKRTSGISCCHKELINNALKSGYSEILQELVLHGLDINIKDLNGKAAFDYIDNNIPEIYKLKKLANYKQKNDSNEAVVQKNSVESIIFSYLKQHKQHKTDNFTLLDKIQYNVWHFVKNSFLMPNFIKGIAQSFLGENNFTGKAKSREHYSSKKEFANIKSVEDAMANLYFQNKIAHRTAKAVISEQSRS